eukprot:jgi/Tetstr1/441941/TSEL_030148.t1
MPLFRHSSCAAVTSDGHDPSESGSASCRRPNKTASLASTRRSSDPSEGTPPVVRSTAGEQGPSGAEPSGRNRKPLRSCYRIGRVLGVGAYAAVRYGVHVRTGAKVAVKSFFESKSSRETAQREIKLLQEADHTSVIRFVEYFKEEGGVFLVTELVPGRDAYACLSDRGSYAEDDCRTIAHVLLRALAHLHGRGIAHRDLKLGNVMFGEGDCLSSLKIIDFGLASKLTQDKPHFSESCGTPMSTAPEVLIKQARYGTSCDLWSLGCMMFKLLSGEPPFEGDTSDLRGLVVRIRLGQYSMDDPAWQLISEGAKDFVRSLLTVDPARRPTASSALLHPWLQE